MWEERLGVSKKDDYQDVNHHDLCYHHDVCINCSSPCPMYTGHVSWHCLV